MNKVGLDAGGSLLKLVYFEKEQLHKKLYPVSQLSEACNWLSILAPGAEVCVTGGKAKNVVEVFKGNARIIPEFSAIEKGAEFIIEKELEKKPRFIVVMAGTGTSIFLFEKGSLKRILGTGLGGGTFFGLGSVLTNEANYTKLAEMAKKGDRSHTDLMVSEIYTGTEAPVPEHLTASNFGKANANVEPNSLAASLANMIAETLTLLTIQIGGEFDIKDVILLGGALEGNEALKNNIKEHHETAGLIPHFPSLGIWAGAIGALLL